MRRQQLIEGDLRNPRQNDTANDQYPAKKPDKMKNRRVRKELILPLLHKPESRDYRGQDDQGKKFRKQGGAEKDAGQQRDETVFFPC